MTILRNLQRLLEPLRQRVALMVGRGVVKRVKDSAPLQTCQVSLLAGELRDQVERFQEFGFSSYPKEGAEAVVVFVGGNRDHGLIVGVDDRRYRIKISEGEVVLYNAFGDFFRLYDDGRAEIQASARVELTAPLVHVTGDVVVDGDITDLAGSPGDGSSMELIRDMFNVHHHGSGNPPTTQMP